MKMFLPFLIASLLIPLSSFNEMPTSSSEEINDGSCRIRLLSIKCNVTEDSWGTDEIYISINGTETGVMSMSKGKTLSLSHLSPVYCNGSGYIKVYDQDEGKNSLYDSDDLLGTHKVYCEESTKDRRPAYFTEDGANYYIEYEVFR